MPKLKMDGEKVAVSSDGHPIYVMDDNTEVPVNGPQALGKIAELQRENQTFRTRAETAETAVKVFDGLDVEKAKAAIETVANLDQSKLLDAGKVEEIKRGIVKANEEATAKIMKEHGEKLLAEQQKAKDLESALYGEKVGGAFARSKFIADKVAVPPDMVQAAFGKHFKVEDGKIVPYGTDGNKLFSRAKHGEVADFEEGLEILVESYPNRDSILKGVGGGAGARGAGAGAGAGGGGQKTIDRAKWETMDHAERGAKMKEGYKVVA